MKGRIHLAVGIGAYSVAVAVAPKVFGEASVFGVALAAFGSLFPDIDHPNALIWKPFRKEDSIKAPKAIRVIFAVFLFAFSVYLMQDSPFVICILTPLFIFSPHRTFSHSIEGFVLASLIFYNLGFYSGNGWAFAVGYASHLWLSDIFTSEGVPLFYAGNWLSRKIPLEKLSEKINFNTLGKNISIHSFFKTGTRFENFYGIAWGIIAFAFLSMQFFG